MNRDMRCGIDVGSTTAKVVVLDHDDNAVYQAYRRHDAKIQETVLGILEEIEAQIIGQRLSPRLRQRGPPT